MNLRVQVEPLRAALQASSPWRHAHHAALQLTCERSIGSNDAPNHHAQSRTPKRSYTAIRRCPLRTASTRRSMASVFSLTWPSMPTPSARAR